MACRRAPGQQITLKIQVGFDLEALEVITCHKPGHSEEEWVVSQPYPLIIYSQPAIKVAILHSKNLC